MISIQPLPNEEAQAFWADKVPLSPSQFYKLSNEAKTRAFAISGIAKGDELATVFGALQRAIDKGISFEKFKDDIAETIKKRGWTGPKAWRVDNIFRTNIQTAYSVGRYKQMKQVAVDRPFWQYSAVDDSRTRPTHRAMHGKVFPHDHEFWDQWYPPNGFRCRCGVTSLSQEDINAENLTVETEDPSNKLIEPIMPETGVKLPARALLPDRGFANNPGRTVWGGVVESATKPGSWSDMAKLPTAARLKRPALKTMGEVTFNQSKLLKAGLAEGELTAAFEKLYGQEIVLTDAIGEPVIATLDAMLKNKASATYIPVLGELTTQPFEIWLVPQLGEAGKVQLVKRYVSLSTKDAVVLEAAGGVIQSVATLDLASAEAQRVGILLHKGD